MPSASTSRRRWLAAAVVSALEACRTARRGEFLGDIPFDDEGSAPLDQLLGEELDGRQFTDLTSLDRSHAVIPTSRFYIRTAASHLLPATDPWPIRIAGAHSTVGELAAQAEPQGRHLMECAGNDREVHFGMIGVAEWAGVPLVRLLDGLGFPQGERILISGFDRYAAPPRTASVPGASWIFSRRDLESSGAFLATSMNGQPLTREHGAPIRLVVPGWYGCACIKWLTGIAPAADDTPSTSQMREYAARTMQKGIPELARDYQPAVIDAAAMPIRVEKWQAGGRLEYRVAGIVWGGAPAPRRLEIRFRGDQPYVPIAHLYPASGNTWGFWSHVWTPRRPGMYRLQLRVADPSVRTRRLDTRFYVRTVTIEKS